MQTQIGEFLTVQQAADLLGIRPATVRHWVFRRERLPYVKVGRAVRIPKQAVDQLIKENTFVPTRAKKAKAGKAMLRLTDGTMLEAD